MSDKASQIQRIKEAVEALSDQQRQAIEEALEQDVDVLFEWAEKGDIVSLLALVEDAPGLLVRVDRLGQNLLHHASRDPSGVMAELFTETPSPALWQRDAFGALPLDLAEEAGNTAVIDLLTPLTYPQLFLEEIDPLREPQGDETPGRDEQADQAQRDKLAGFARYEALAQRQTLPAWTDRFTPQSLSERLDARGQDLERGIDEDRDR